MRNQSKTDVFSAMSTSTKCAVLHNVQSYALLHVFAECCGQKCKGITQYHVFLCLIWLCCTLTPILFSSQRPIAVDEWRALPCCVPICIWVDIVPKVSRCFVQSIPFFLEMTNLRKKRKTHRLRYVFKIYIFAFVFRENLSIRSFVSARMLVSTRLLLLTGLFIPL